MPMTDRNGTRWFTVRDLATELERSTKTIRRLLRPYREECLLTRDKRHPRKLLIMPDLVAKSIRERLLD